MKKEYGLAYGIGRFGCFAGAVLLLSLCLTAGGCGQKDIPGRQTNLGVVGTLAANGAAQDADGYIYEPRNETVYATDDVNIREQATGQSKIVDVLKKGQSVTRIAYNPSWSKVSLDGFVYYVASQYITPDPPEEETEGTSAQKQSEPEAEETSAEKKSEPKAEETSGEGTEDKAADAGKKK